MTGCPSVYLMYAGVSRALHREVPWGMYCGASEIDNIHINGIEEAASLDPWACIDIHRHPAMVPAQITSQGAATSQALNFWQQINA